MADRDPQIGARRNYPAYDEDFAGWVAAQASMLRERRFGELDLQNLVEEVESVGRSEFRVFSSAIERIIFHMLKWDYQPDLRGQSWRRSINDQRKMVRKLLRENPSFKARQLEAVETAFIGMPDAVDVETGIPADRLPQTCPYDWDQIMTRVHDFDPDRPWPN